MAQNDTAFAGSIPDLYDKHLVPLIFETYAQDLAGRVAARTPHAVLETAAGSGVVTRALAPRLPRDARYVVSDLNPPMLERAQAQQPSDDRIAWQPADALDLPFDPDTFDAVLCQFGVMFFPDRVRGYREARRVLRPGGTFAFNAWDRIEENALPDCVTEALAVVFPDDPPRFMARTPHGYHDTDQIAADLRAAGFDRFDIATVTETSRAENARSVAVAFCQGTPLRGELEDRAPGRLGEITDEVEEALIARYGTGPVAGPIRAHVVVAEA